MKQKRLSIYQIVFMGVFAALLCILAPNSIPIGTVPITLTNLVIYVCVYVLGVYFGTGSVCIYLLLGIAGLPVFSGYQGGLAKIAGPTGGYIVGFIFMAIIGGLFIEISHRNIVLTVIGWIIGTAVAYAFGTVWFVNVMDTSYAYALRVCVYPFILLDLAKIVVGTLLGKAVFLALKKAGLLHYIKPKRTDSVEKQSA